MIWLMILLLCLTTACSPAKEVPKDEIVVGVFEPLNGIYGESGRETLRGVTLANERRPRALGKKVVLSVYNTKSQTFESANAVAILTDKGANGLIGTFGTDSMNQAKPAIAAAEVPALTGSTSPDLAKNYWITQISVDDVEQAKAMAQYAVEDLGLRDIALVIDAEMRYGAHLAYTFEHMVPTDVNIYKVYYHSGETRFRNEIDRLKKLPIDGIYCPGDAATSAYLLSALKKEMPDVAVMGADRWENPSFYEIAKDAAEGVYFTAHYARYDTFNAASETFHKAYEKKYGESPTSYAAIGYDAYNLFLDAAESAGSDAPEAVAKELRHLERFNGALGIADRRGPRRVPILKQYGRRGRYVETVEVPR